MRRCRASAEAFCGNFTIRDGRQELMPEHRVNSLSGRGSIASCVLGSVPDATPRAKVLKDDGGVQQRARIWGSLPPPAKGCGLLENRSEAHTSELQSLMRNTYAVFR